MDFIERLRQKSPETRKKIAIGTSAFITLVIFAAWASVLHFGVDQKKEQAVAAVESGTDVKPFSAFWSVMSEGWKDLSDNINRVKTGIGEAKGMLENMKAISSTTASAASSSEVFMLPDDLPEGGKITQ